MDPSRDNHYLREHPEWRAHIHTRRSAPVPAHVLVRALSDASLLLHTCTADVVKTPRHTAPPQVCASSTDMASAETKTGLRITPMVTPSI